MATYSLMKDELKTCPYNPNHKVASRRLQLHIVKCRRNAPNADDLVDCPFNALHKVPKDDLSHHILLCKDSRQVIREMEESRNRPIVENRPIVVRTELPPSSDDWDLPVEGDGYVVPGLDRKYDQVKKEEGGEPSKKPFAVKSNIEIQCMSKSERKDYYKELAEKVRAKELPEHIHKNRVVKDETKPFASGSRNGTPVKMEDDPHSVRRPVYNPFQTTPTGGIGRGSTAPGSGGIGRGGGLGRGRVFGAANQGSPQMNNSPNIKREPTDEYPNSKRRSPDDI